LPKWAENKLRVEVVIRGKQLEEDNLNIAKNLNENIYDEYKKYLERLTMKQNIQLTDKQMIELPQALLSTYTLWKQGYDVRSLMSRATYYRRRKQLLKHGINIDFKPIQKDTSNVIPLLKVLEAKPAEIPSWAFKDKLIHPSATQLNHA